MLNPNKLKVAKENTTHYSDVLHVKCDILGSDNSVIEIEVEKTKLN